MISRNRNCFYEESKRWWWGFLILPLFILFLGILFTILTQISYQKCKDKNRECDQVCLPLECTVCPQCDLECDTTTCTYCIEHTNSTCIEQICTVIPKCVKCRKEYQEKECGKSKDKYIGALVLLYIGISLTTLYLIISLFIGPYKRFCKESEYMMDKTEII